MDPDLSAADREIYDNRDPSMGQPVGKGDPSAAPILLAKLSKGQEIELICKAYKVRVLFIRQSAQAEDS